MTDFVVRVSDDLMRQADRLRRGAEIIDRIANCLDRHQELSPRVVAQILSPEADEYLDRLVAAAYRLGVGA